MDCQFLAHCRKARYEEVRTALESKKIPYDRRVAGFSICCMHGNFKMIELFIEHGICAWTTGLHCACRGGHLDIAIFMINKGASYTDSKIIYSACDSGNLHLVLHLVRLGHSVEDVFNRACRRNQTEIINYFIDNKDIDVDAAILQAVYGGHLEVIYRLLDMGGHIDMPNAAEIASKFGRYNILAFWIYIGEKKFGRSLYYAWGHRCMKSMHLLLSSTGVEFENFPEMFISLCGRIPHDIALLMINYAYRENIYISYAKGMEAAVRYNNLRLVTYFSSKRARLLQNTFVHACKYGYDAIVQYFITQRRHNIVRPMITEGIYYADVHRHKSTLHILRAFLTKFDGQERVYGHLALKFH